MKAYQTLKVPASPEEAAKGPESFTGEISLEKDFCLKHRSQLCKPLTRLQEFEDLFKVEDARGKGLMLLKYRNITGTEEVDPLRPVSVFPFPRYRGLLADKIPEVLDSLGDSFKYRRNKKGKKELRSRITANQYTIMVMWDGLEPARVLSATILLEGEKAEVQTHIYY